MIPSYDIREHLAPRRVANAMWDYSWIWCHQPGGAFEDWDKATDELLERGFNAVRIEACPWLIGHLDGPEGSLVLPKQTHDTWGVCALDFEHRPLPELIEFLQILRRKNIHAILSTWNMGAVGFPGATQASEGGVEALRKGWERVLKAVRSHGLADRILYVDLDQEYPFFSPTQKALAALADTAPTVPSDEMEAAGLREEVRGSRWNEAQKDFVHAYFRGSCAWFQSRFPEFRFTLSITHYWEEIRSLDLRCFDVLELHFWLHSPRFDSRTLFNKLGKHRANETLRDYQDRVDATFRTIRPMLMLEMHNRLAFARDWAREWAVPLVTTEAWGPWWHMDHPDTKWEWLRDWCEECMAASEGYGLWGITPWNYAHPYWDNWKDAEWYRKVNARFLQS